MNRVCNLKVSLELRPKIYNKVVDTPCKTQFLYYEKGVNTYILY